MLHFKRLLVPVLTAATLVAFARAATRRRVSETPAAASGSNRQRYAPRHVDESTGTFAPSGGFDLLPWIPVIVPLMALVLVVGIYLIYAAVL
jgi:hypothetical protein